MKTRLVTYSLTALLVMTARIAPAAFSNVPINGLVAASQGSTAWADYDNDGRLDFLQTGATNLVTGEKISQLWRNTGVTFTIVVIPNLPQVKDSAVAWGDYDNDGRLDFLLTGTTNINSSGAIAQLWQNTGAGFVNVTPTVAPSLPGVRFGSVAWGDFDNDGHLDFLLTGEKTNLTYVSQLWRNTGDTFTNVLINDLPQLGKGSVAWGDYDNDGRLDFLLTGTINNATGESQLWRNMGKGFSNVTASAAFGLPRVAYSSVAWGDYDNDGRLDFLLTGTTNVNTPRPVSQLWRNAGSAFTNVTATLTSSIPGVYRSTVTWGDYDNDGRLDFLLTGTTNVTSSGFVSQLWQNMGNGFSNVTANIAFGLPGVVNSSAAWGDYDNDGQLDFLLAGTEQTSLAPISQIWRNNTPVTNTPPIAPIGLVMTATTNAVVLSWNSATDGQTPASGLSYNVRAGSAPGSIDLFAGQVNATNGFRRVPALGNAMMRHSLPLTGLTNGQTVYWSVQAVDTSFAGGPFATETSVVSIPQLTITPSNTTNVIVSWTPPTFGWRLTESPDSNGMFWNNSPSGEQNPVTVPTTNGLKFYRLTTP